MKLARRDDDEPGDPEAQAHSRKDVGYRDRQDDLSYRLHRRELQHPRDVQSYNFV